MVDILQHLQEYAPSTSHTREVPVCDFLSDVHFSNLVIFGEARPTYCAYPVVGVALRDHVTDQLEVMVVDGTLWINLR